MRKMRIAAQFVRLFGPIDPPIEGMKATVYAQLDSQALLNHSCIRKN